MSGETLYQLQKVVHLTTFCRYLLTVGQIAPLSHQLQRSLDNLIILNSSTADLKIGERNHSIRVYIPFLEPCFLSVL